MEKKKVLMAHGFLSLTIQRRKNKFNFRFDRRVSLKKLKMDLKLK